MNRNDKKRTEVPSGMNGVKVMRTKVLAVAVGLIAASLAGAVPAHAFGPGGLARGLAQSSAFTIGTVAAPETASTKASDRFCAAFGNCIDGRSIAIKASWRADRDQVMPLDQLTLTSLDVEQALAATRSQISPFIMPEAPAVDYGVLTGSVPAGDPL